MSLIERDERFAAKPFPTVVGTGWYVVVRLGLEWTHSTGSSRATGKLCKIDDRANVACPPLMMTDDVSPVKRFR